MLCNHAARPEHQEPADRQVLGQHESQRRQSRTEVDQDDQFELLQRRSQPREAAEQLVVQQLQLLAVVRRAAAAGACRGSRSASTR